MSQIDSQSLLAFAKELRSLISDTWGTVRDYADHAWNGNLQEDEEGRLIEAKLTYILQRIQVRVVFGLELLGLHHTLDHFLEGLAKLKHKPTDLNYVPYIGEPSSPLLEYLEQFASAFDALAPQDSLGEKSTERLRLERILHGTAKVVYDRKLMPRNETDVRNAVYEVLGYWFPDTVRDPGIAKVFKVFKPDIGVRSLETAVEYKFVDSSRELKTAISGIYEDISGYAGSKEWTNFISVIYMTDSFATLAQLEAEFSLSKLSDAWKPILVTGRGRRGVRRGNRSGVVRRGRG